MSQHALGNALGFLLTDCARLFRRLCDQEFSASGLEISTGDLRVLTHVIRYGTSNQRDLAERVAVEPMTVSASLDRLEVKGLVTRQAGTFDRRAKFVQATEEGLRFYDSLGATFEAIYCRCYQGMSDAETAGLIEIMSQLRTNLTTDRQLSRMNNPS